MRLPVQAQLTFQELRCNNYYVQKDTEGVPTKLPVREGFTDLPRDRASGRFSFP